MKNLDAPGREAGRSGGLEQKEVAITAVIPLSFNFD
jgi:hypothetical protein